MRYLLILTNSNSGKFRFWQIPILTNSNSDKFQFWQIPILTNSNSDKFQSPRLMHDVSMTCHIEHTPDRTFCNIRATKPRTPSRIQCKIKIMKISVLSSYTGHNFQLFSFDFADSFFGQYKIHRSAVIGALKYWNVRSGFKWKEDPLDDSHILSISNSLFSSQSPKKTELQNQHIFQDSLYHPVNLQYCKPNIP